MVKYLNKSEKQDFKDVLDFDLHAHTGARSLCLFLCFVALRPTSTAMVMVGRSVHLTNLFPGQA